VNNCYSAGCYSAGSALSNLRLADSWLTLGVKGVAQCRYFSNSGYSNADVRTFCCKNQHQIFQNL